MQLYRGQGAIHRCPLGGLKSGFVPVSRRPPQGAHSVVWSSDMTAQGRSYSTLNVVFQTLQMVRHHLHYKWHLRAEDIIPVLCDEPLDMLSCFSGNYVNTLNNTAHCKVLQWDFM